MRKLLTAAFAATVLLAGEAQACARLGFTPFYLEGRARTPDGEWRSTWMEADDTKVRFEQAHPATPWGRLAVAGDTKEGHAEVFPVAADAKRIPDDARVAWKTSLADGLAELQVTTGVFDWWPGRRDGPKLRVNDIPCQMLTETDDTRGNTICLADGNVPVLVKDPAGRPLFEATRVIMRPADPARFSAPSTYPRTTRKPKYLWNWGCDRSAP
ncbi:hypothetical protein [Caulobacter mirabilis]|uniref:Uncharacterized protein n=1 Tax=Caulobacter mirabilis TaxID=69666 RepID=A0A2D2B000_9CAUL|nr:hypothetical protein [Caulobacter mirabilis]ATQ43497.1 hypothetical protein CSW64_14305 [Caulobacter mirabilis]